MSRAQPHQLIHSHYPVSMEVQTRFQDMDVMGHLNNVAFAALFEHARVMFNRALRPWDERPESERSVVGQVIINYLQEGNYPLPVTIGSGIGKIGNSSYVISQGMFQNDLCIATCDTVVAVRTNGEAKALRPEVTVELNAMLLKNSD
jgi:acyl-CoA thioester hydrolase